MRGATLAAAAVVALPQAGVVAGTLRFPARETELLAARGRSAFALVVPSGRARSFVVVRVGPDGRAAKERRVRFALAGYLMDVSAGADGVYAGTAVMRRFLNVPDVLVRIDARTLRIRARARFPASVAALAR